MNKKVISAILAGACAVSAMGLSVSAATSSTSGNKTVTSVGTAVSISAKSVVITPTINVSVPQSVSAIVNPYGVGINYNGTDYSDAGVQSLDVYTIINQTTASGILVDVTPTITVGTSTYTVPSTKAANKNYTYPSIKVVDSDAALADGGKMADNKTVANTKGDFTVVKQAEDTAETQVLEGDITTRKAIYAYIAAITTETPVRIITAEDVAADEALQQAKDTAGGSYDGAEPEGLTSEDVNATATTSKNVTTVTVDLKTLGDTVSNTAEDADSPYVDDATIVVFQDATSYKLGTSNTVTKTNTASHLAVLPQAETGTFTYAQFKIFGDVTKNSNNAGWTSSDTVTFGVILDLQPTAAESIDDL